MTKQIPDKLYVTIHEGGGTSVTNSKGFAIPPYHEYTCSDIHKAVVAERDRLKEINAELLEALVDMVAANSCALEDENDGSYILEAFQKAEAAIAKARGA